MNRRAPTVRRGLKAGFSALEARLLNEIKAVYGSRLVSVAVFGSVGRGTQRFDSDLDLLIIAKDLPGGRMDRVREFDVIEARLQPFMQALGKRGIRTEFSPVFKTPQEAERGSPLFLDMVEDARILYDRGGFFASRLQQLRRRLAQLGARRIRKGGAWYWDLKPDFRPGDVIEL